MYSGFFIGFVGGIGNGNLKFDGSHQLGDGAEVSEKWSYVLVYFADSGSAFQFVGPLPFVYRSKSHGVQLR